MIRVIGFIAFFSLAWTTAGAAGKEQPCDNARAVWAFDKGDTRQILYGTEGVQYGSSIYIEEWRGGKLAWRATGKATCSNGASICYAMLDNDSGLTGNDASTGVVIESIDADNNGVADWAVLAAAAQNLYYNGGLKVTWYNDFEKPTDERILPANVFKLLSCRKTKELVLFQPPATDPEELTGALYANSDVCDQYRSTGALTPTETGKVDGLWWMDDTTIVGRKMDCKILSWSTDSLRAKCQLDGTSKIETFPFRTKGVVREIMSQTLKLCNRIEQ
ncbi:hypothetical protein IHQ71_31350 (plasmid) [Rhizobium sp. TH2]|uniref:hypothetical protein n=1 Tax=Rhizobium sp. TH2 TaxID=2775403 RepID=UPI00215790A2|nr:hypothetical protein [Rhizobium sp. TH2]UVC12662.1 hypothetical protein IHQ71_31350 [Rhizobium sp. TH2]